jgi:hypothetical protein
LGLIGLLLLVPASWDPFFLSGILAAKTCSFPPAPDVDPKSNFGSYRGLMATSIRRPFLHTFLHTRFRPQRAPAEAITTKLSVLDSIAAPFPPANGLWIYDKPKSTAQKKALLTSHLLESLQKTINAYPQWAGQLQLAPFENGGDPRKRFGRLLVKHGAKADPGFEVVVAESNRRLMDFIPSPSERAQGSRYWNAAEFPQEEFFSTDPMAGHDGRSFAGLPSSSVQLTTFACGGVGVALKTHHSLSDAGSMMTFMRDWAETNCAMAQEAPLPVLEHVFDPSMIEKATGGDLNNLEPDQNLLQTSRSMPIHRYDRWLDTDSRPPFFASLMDVTKPPGLKIEEAKLSPAGPVPWEECDFLSPASNIHIHFNSKEIDNIWKKSSETSTSPISRLDALLAHIWQRLSIARQADDSKDIYLNVVLGIRPRLDPPLPSNFLGSPTMHVHTAMRPSKITNAPVGEIASAIRATTTKFNQESLGAVLHDFTYEAGVQRLWQFFIGQRHTTVTTWLGLGASTLEFAPGHTPRHVHFLLPSTMDGVIKIMEAPPNRETTQENDEAGKRERKHWSKDGVTVAMVMNPRVMKQLLSDPLLRGE